MSAARLHAVPDPEPGPDEGQGTGEWPVPAPAVVAPRAPADDEVPSVPEGRSDDDSEEAGERPGLLRSLLPYCDPHPLAELGPLAVEMGRTGGPQLLRTIGRLLREMGRMLRWYGRGILVLLIILTGWLSGSIGKHGSVGARLAGAGFAAYAVAKTCTEFPAAPWITLAAVFAAVVMAGMGHIQIPGSTPAKKARRAKGGEKATAKRKAAPGVSKEDAPAGPRRGLLGVLGRRRKTAPAASSTEDPEEDDDEGAHEDDEEEVPETPAAPSREDVIRALHHLYRGGSGVLNTALAQHLQLPHTRALREALTAAGITLRPGVRTPAGNGPGVHREDIPPLPRAREDPQGSSVAAGQIANTNANNADIGAGEGLGAYSNDWSPEELAQGHRWVQDPAKPCAWKIEPRPEK